ncbi:MAG: 23S rRNA (uracil(1939)-C(5))-methyltransferase RlmD [Lachnospiraceae bacterium]|nr:23S rRNA (uracil(1939)-C(5))-methyltransferase RlmD [Lachnospiraceae bacterium]
MNKKFNKNDIVDVHITDIGNDGEGIGHVDGYAIFVKGALPGDLVKAHILKAKKNFAFAKVEEIIEPSKNRVAPKCAIAEKCGGCSLQHMDYEAQLKWKEKKILECIKRIGGYEEDEFTYLNILGYYYELESGDLGESTRKFPSRFRNKAQFPVGVDKEGRLISGFFAGRSHSIIPTEDCLIQSEYSALINKAVLEYMKENNVRPYDEVNGTGVIRHIISRVAYFTDEIMVCIVINADKIKYEDGLIERLVALNSSDIFVKNNKKICSISLNINREKNNVILGIKTECIYGKSTIQDKIGDILFNISPVSFFQVNPIQTKKLYDTVLDFTDFKGDETVYDLYCGIGSISLYVANHVKKVVGVEIVEKAIDDAKENAKLNHISNAEFYAGAAEEVVPKLYEESNGALRADVVIVDPPRKGCDEVLLDTIVKMEPEKIVYVSCDPATLARDLKILREKGYKLVIARGTDMFCHSVHVETVALLNNKFAKAKDFVQIGIDAEDYYRIKDSEKKTE